MLAPKIAQHSVAPFVAAVAPHLPLSARAFRLVMLLARLALGSVLLYAGVVKVPNPAAFADAIANFELLPPLFNWIAALTLPWVEIVTGLLLICGLWLRGSALVSVLMFLGFSGAVLSALARGLNIECGCFGTDAGARVGVHALCIEAAGLTAGVLVFFFPRQSLALLRFPKKVVHVLVKQSVRVYRRKET